MHWPASQASAQERNEAIDHTARSGKHDSKEQSGYHRRSLLENLTDRFRTLTSARLWAGDVDVQDAEIAVQVGIINRMLLLARPKSARIAKNAGRGARLILRADLCNSALQPGTPSLGRSPKNKRSSPSGITRGELKPCFTPSATHWTSTAAKRGTD